MSKPKAPYYHKKSSDTYHWEMRCTKNNYSDDDSDWKKTHTKPNKEQCNECKGK